jgi:N-acetyl-beta-hexosaminidase
MIPVFKQAKTFHALDHVANMISNSNVVNVFFKQVVSNIVSVQFFGARHGLETLNQLMTFDDVADSLVIMQDVNITDSPAFPFRALALDTARNYFSVASIMRTIDGMAASKLNTFHWHLTDSHSFPFQSSTYPQLSEYGAYTQQQASVNHINLCCMSLETGLSL